MSTFMERMPISFNKDSIFLCERSIHSAFNVFSKLGNMPTEEEFMLKFIYGEYGRKSNIDGIIFIQSMVENCLARIKARGFSSDKLINLDYLKRIEEKYMEWLSTVDVPVFFISDQKIKEDSAVKVLEEAFVIFDIK